MALEGSIKDFAIADIFQLINLQKKGGILTIHQNEASATINFCKGQIVDAVLSKGEETEKIGRLLVSAGKLTEKEIDDALSLQKKTGNKIGQVLVSSEFISREDLREALQTQIKDVIFQILRWKEGWYRFDIQEIEYDREYQIPVQTDFVLMEGIRMLDEWPYIEGIIPSESIVFSQNYKSIETETLFSSLNTSELTVFNLVDGRRNIKEIIDLTQFSEFEVYKILATLKVSGLISQTASSNRVEGETIGRDGAHQRGLWTAVQIAILSFTVSFMLILMPAREMLGIHEISSASEMLKKRIARRELSSIQLAIRYYFLLNGILPDSLELLYTERYLRSGFTTDPWGNPFVYEKSNPSGPGYTLYSIGADKTRGTEDDIF